MHEKKGCWTGSRVLEHLGMVIDSEQMCAFVWKVEQLRALAKKLLLLAQRNRRLVPLQLLRHFGGV